jgi:hypothetical protein
MDSTSYKSGEKNHPDVFFSSLLLSGYLLSIFTGGVSTT